MLLPVITDGQSDSACLDNMIELLTLTGRSLPHVMMMLIPEAWDGNELMDPVKKAFYEFHASFMEPWDGPASISFTDGKMIGATLDRNGLRPSRYCVTTDDRVIMASESGVLPVDPKLIKEKGRLQPGKMFVVDLEKGRIISDDELKKTICSQKPYAEWLNKYKIRLEELPEPRVMFTDLEHDQIFKYQKSIWLFDRRSGRYHRPYGDWTAKNLSVLWVQMFRLLYSATATTSQQLFQTTICTGNQPSD